ncbi:hypothetical protein BS78_05G172900 [Paspalum vaginatum]|nr:hypothetical protein BS78_05G172900 [Paspalum vaginatum]KAJ1275916.1 hypothetical protein BS78_05G172900 [Paspalum vaginatum]
MPASAPPTPSWCASVLLLTRHDDLIEISVGPLSSAADRLLQISRPYLGVGVDVQPPYNPPLCYHSPLFGFPAKQHWSNHPHQSMSEPIFCTFLHLN